MNTFNKVCAAFMAAVMLCLVQPYGGTIIIRGPILGATAGPSLVASVAGSTNADSVTTAAINTTGANLIVISASWYEGFPIIAPTLTDSAGNTWIEAVARTGGGTTYSRLFYCFSPTTSASHTFTYQKAGSEAIYPAISVLAFSGIATSPLDQTSANGTASSWATLQPGSLTPSQANTIVVQGLAFEDNSSGTITINSSYNTPVTQAYVAATSQGSSISYKILTSATAQNPTWSTSSNSTNGVATAASFKY